MPEVVVLGTHGGRQFKAVFEEAQKQLRDKFGMEMTELPVKEKVTISQRRGMATFFGLSQHIGSGIFRINCCSGSLSMHTQPPNAPKNKPPLRKPGS